MKQKKRYILISVILHVCVILIIIFAPWSSKKDELVETIQVVSADSLPGAPAAGTPSLKAPADEPVTPITEPEKKDEILVPEKLKPEEPKKIIKPKPVPKPKPKVHSKLKDRLNNLLEDEKESKKSSTGETEDVKKNSLTSQESVPEEETQAGQSDSTSMPG